MLHAKQIMEDFHSVESCILSLETDVDRDFYDSGSDKEFYEKHSLDLWGCKCKETQSLNLLTPPTSPQHDSFSETPSSDDFLCDFTSCVDNETLTRTFLDAEKIIAEMKLDMDLEKLNSNLIQDCMWSKPGLEIAGFGVPSVQNKRKRSVDENQNHIASKKSHLDINSNDCVDPAAVFPLTSRSNTQTPTAQLSISLPSADSWTAGLETPSASESDDEEIDVVGVAEKSLKFSRHSTPALNSSIKSRPTIKVINPSNHKLGAILSANLPATTSMSAQVAALHNYSSTTHSSKSQSCLKNTLSAPHTPSGHGHSSFKRSRPFSSSPTSPQVCKKQRLVSDKHRVITTEKDLHSVVRKLNSSGRRPKFSDTHSYSRSSSDNEDMTESGKRAYHNVLERKRRDDLRHSFHMLRSVVPEIRDNEKAPKMVILNQSTEYVLDLTRHNQTLNAELQRQKLIQEQLRKQLSQLRRGTF